MMNIYQAKKETDKHLVTVNWEERKKSGGGGFSSIVTWLIHQIRLLNQEKISMICYIRLQWEQLKLVKGSTYPHANEL